MAATKDQRRLSNRCIENEIPVFVLTGTNKCVMAALNAYLEEARKIGCNACFLSDLESNIILDFCDFQSQEPEKVKIPD